MRLPVRHVAGNVVWTRHGTVWALFRVEGHAPAMASRRARMQRLHAIEGLVKRLHGESMWLSLCPQVDPYAVVRAMVEDVDLEACPRYEALGHRVLDTLEQLELTSRTDWLAVPLPAQGWRQAVREVAAAAREQVSQELGLVPAGVPVAEEERRLAQAGKLPESWPDAVQVRAATEAEILWVYGHSARRGVGEPLLPEPEAAPRTLGRGRGVAALEQVVLTEGGLPEGEEEPEETSQVPSALKRRWLQASTRWGHSYQALMTLTEMPEEFTFPGSEYLAGLDDFGFPVDWVARLKVTSGKKVERRIRRKARDVAGQPEEYADDPAGVPERVPKAAAGLREFQERVTGAASEVEVRAMVGLCVWGSTPGEAEQRAQEIEGWFGQHEYAVQRPVGRQEQLFSGMLPGAPLPPTLVACAQTLLARDFAMAGPFSATRLGDERGPLYGLQLSGGGVQPVLMDFERGPKEQTSASAAFIGELGSGKSTAMKAAVFSLLAAGRKLRRRRSRGRAVIVDRTPRQEWVSFARSCPGTVQVVTVDGQAQVSLDPLRLLTRPRSDGRVDWRAVQRRTETFLIMLLGLRASDELADVLSERITAVLNGPEPSMGALLADVRARAQQGDEACRTLARKLHRHAESDLGRAVFDPSLPALDTDADQIVFSVSHLQLPTARELEHAELFAQLSREKLFGRAGLYLIAAVSQHLAFARSEEFTACVWDECWWLTRSPEGLELLIELLRDGRKHNAGVLVGSHDAHDIGPDTEEGRIALGLIRRRFLFRQTQKTLAARGLAFMGLDAADPFLLEKVTAGLSPVQRDRREREDRAGECLARDLYGRLGELRVVIPLDPHVQKAIHSDPEDVDDPTDPHVPAGV